MKEMNKMIGQKLNEKMMNDLSAFLMKMKTNKEVMNND